MGSGCARRVGTLVHRLSPSREGGWRQSRARSLGSWAFHTGRKGRAAFAGETGHWHVDTWAVGRESSVQGRRQPSPDVRASTRGGVNRWPSSKGNSRVRLPERLAWSLGPVGRLRGLSPTRVVAVWCQSASFPFETLRTLRLDSCLSGLRILASL